MKKVDRLPAPEKLDGQDQPKIEPEDKETEFDKVYAHRAEQIVKANEGKKTSSYKFKLYSHKAVKERLEEMFHGKCAYCESYYGNTQPVDVEHFRPKNAIANSDHEGYWWLAMAWNNLLPSCIDCNRKRNQKWVDPNAGLLIDFLDQQNDAIENAKSGKGTVFPLKDETLRVAFHTDHANGSHDVSVDQEPRLLLDPTIDDPDDHLVFSTKDISVVGYKTEEGRTSIRVYGLNRLSLVQERTRLLRELDFLLDTYVGLGRAANDIRDKLITPRQEQLAGANEEEKAVINAELADCRNITEKLSRLQENIITSIREKAEDPQQSYSALINAWLRDKT